MKYLFSAFLGVFLGLSSMAQDQVDALRYSQYSITGTARFMGMGGSMGSLGNDLTAMTINPAGVAVFSKTEIGLSTGIEGVGTESSFLGQTGHDSKVGTNIGNAGFVARFKNRRADSGKAQWKNFSFGLTYNRVNSFDRNTYISGINNTSSKLDQYAYFSSGTQLGSLDMFGAELAWQTWLMDTLPGQDDQYVRNVLPEHGQEQQISETSEGYMGQTDLAFGSNFANTLFIGGSIGYQSIGYRMERSHTEIAPDDTSSSLQEWGMIDYLRASGSGVNLKFGLIYRPLDWLRIGASIHSPTFFRMEENYSTTMYSVFDTIGYSYSSPEGLYDYRLRTPFRAMGSLGFVIARTAVLNLEYEHVDYSQANLRANGNPFNEENEVLRNDLKRVGNLRAGVEVKLVKFYIRGGYGIDGDPYTGDYNFNNAKYSLGFGYKGNHWKFDIAYQLQNRAENYVVYDPDLVGLARINSESHTIMASAGLRF